MAKRGGKRSKGEGTFHRLPSGSWQVQYMDGYKDNGKRNIISFTAPTRAEAADKLLDYKQRQQEAASAAVSFSTFADDRYANYRTQVEASIYCNYYYTLALLKDYFGDTMIDQIKTSHINAFVNSPQERNYSTSAVRKCQP